MRVSKATIYNTLNLFAASGLIRQLSVGNDRCWFDSNTDAHYHFHDLDTGALMDVACATWNSSACPSRRPGMQVDGIDLVIRLRRKRKPDAGPARCSFHSCSRAFRMRALQAGIDSLRMRPAFKPS